MPTRVSAEKIYIFISVVRIKLQKSGFLKHTQARPFKIFLYNYWTIQNKTNSSHSFVGIGKGNTCAKFCKIKELLSCQFLTEDVQRAF